jgi:hypothetical protein
MSLRNEGLEQALLKAALDLVGATSAHAFSMPVPKTSPQLYLSMHEGPVQLMADEAPVGSEERPADATQPAPSAEPDASNLRAALALARPYVVSATERMYDGTNGHGIRQEAARRLAMIDAALATATQDAPTPAQAAVSEEMKRAGVREMFLVDPATQSEAWEEKLARVYLAMRAASPSPSNEGEDTQ